MPAHASGRGYPLGGLADFKASCPAGRNGGELSGCCGPIFAVNAESGEVAWQFDTIGGDQRSRDSWGNDAWKIGGGGGWMTGTYDAKTNTWRQDARMRMARHGIYPLLFQSRIFVVGGGIEFANSQSTVHEIFSRP